jgi:hypothetical protein
MTMFDFDAWAAELEIVGDEAYLPGEESPHNPNQHGRWAGGRPAKLTPEEKREYTRQYMREYRAANLERVRRQHRESKARCKARNS